MARSVHGDWVAWGPTEHLLAATIDTLAVANWQRTGKPGNRPTPFPRPGRKVVRMAELNITPEQIREQLAANRG